MHLDDAMHRTTATTPPSGRSAASHRGPLLALAAAPDDDGEAFLGPRVVVNLGHPAQVGLQWARREPLTHVRSLPPSGLDALLHEVLRYLDGHPYVRPSECAIRGVPQHDGPRREQALRLPVEALRGLAALAQAGPGVAGA